ncbi:two-component sensor histidine kinase [Azorhizobium oxalatiphilum]|uniref:histidine kinase n=1 Tax=Azorhizobium oxalatiphilum TaxID=980631 RepID=A0A917BJD6_9HYPH|nr:PAS domain-containing sensor histidine kinase [Azorhizobium oxalatiphilum]GGF48236.1 two-component sensor histidine kinase [Azorhizobium oxalatiphilum]
MADRSRVTGALDPVRAAIRPLCIVRHLPAALPSDVTLPSLMSFARPTGALRAAARLVPACAVLLGAGSAYAQAATATGGSSSLLVALAGGASAVALTAAAIAAVSIRYRRRAEAELSLRAAAQRADTQALRVLLAQGARGLVLWRDAGSLEALGEAIPAFPDGADADALADGLKTWLGAEALTALAGPLAELQAEGTPFAFETRDASGAPLRLEGRAVAGVRCVAARPVAPIRTVAPPQAAALDALFELSPLPMWRRGQDGALAAVNDAFCRASQSAAPAPGAPPVELLDQAARDAAVAAHRAGKPYAARVRVVAGGKRRLLDVTEAAGAFGAAGLAIDVTEAEAARVAHEQALAAHRRTLDQLNTAVVIFGGDERLVFHNSAYERLFGLDAGFLDQRPSETEVLERLRAQRKVPEQSNFRAWREQLREAYRALEPTHDWWHLPGGQMLSVIASPNAEGGVTYLFEDLSERMALESRYNSLIRIQGETLDGLAEAVAVFGSNGRLRLYNQAFLHLWSLSAQALGERPHIDAVAAMCRPKHGESGAWARIRNVVTALDHREGEKLRLETAGKRVLDGTAQPLPDGGTMVTFRDVTDSVQVERALIERNEALEEADQLKNAFVGHVSYHLRTPLNTLIGYAHMLSEGVAGELNARQTEFLSHVSQSSDALRSLIDDILDLATIDAGAMALDLSEVEVRGTLESAADSVRDLLEEAGVTLRIEASSDLGSFVADGRRVRQILFNLLSNAIAAAPAGSMVALRAERRADGLVLSVRDNGPGIAPEMMDRLFQRFETVGGADAGTRHRGVGLGLSIVRSFMELHGGTVSLAPARGGGTIALCLFPLATRRHEAAA